LRGLFGLRRGLGVAGALDALVVRGLRDLGLHRGLEGVEAGQQRRRGRLQEAGGELVQQAADLFGDVVVQARLVRRHQARLRDLERVLEAARERRQVGMAHGGRVAGQRMRQRDGLLAHRARQLQHPLGERGAQAARLLVGLVQEDVEQAQADAQRADDLVVLGIVGRQLVADGQRVERARAGGGRAGDGGVVGGRLGGALVGSRSNAVSSSAAGTVSGPGVAALGFVRLRTHVAALLDHGLVDGLVELAEVELEVRRGVLRRVLHRLDDGALFHELGGAWYSVCSGTAGASDGRSSVNAGAWACCAGLSAAMSSSPGPVDSKSSRISVSPASSGAGSKASSGDGRVGRQHRGGLDGRRPWA
jgi:hypothetical protein